MRKLSLLTIVGVVLALSTGGAAAATRAPLSSTEYQQVTAIQVALSTVSHKRIASIDRTARACAAIRPASALVGAVRSDCIRATRWLAAGVEIMLHLKPCGRSLNARLRCLYPYYSLLSVAVRGFYHADSHAEHVATDRGLGSRCVAILSDTKRSIADEARMTRYISELVVAIRRRDVLAVTKWGGLYDAATAEAVSAAEHGSLSLCPHR